MGAKVTKSAALFYGDGPPTTETLWCSEFLADAGTYKLYVDTSASPASLWIMPHGAIGSWIQVGSTAGGAGDPLWGSLQGVLSNQTDLQAALDGKSNTTHNHDAAYAAIGHSHSGLAPAGGTTGQVLKKNTNANYDYSWAADNTGAAGGLGYTLFVQALTSSPVDAQTVYFGQLPRAPITTANVSKVYIRKAGTITAANVYCYSGTAGSAEAWSLSIRKNNTTDTLVATVSAATSERVFANSALSIPVVAGDYIEMKSVQPTWVTNPLTTIWGGYLYIE